MSNTILNRRLRPYLFTSFKKRSSCSSTNAVATRAFASQPSLRVERKSKDVTHDFEKRVAQLEGYKQLSECYPRLPDSDHRELCPESGMGLQPGETDKSHVYTVMGTARHIGQRMVDH